MPAGAGQTLMLGIAVELDAQGVVRGVSLAERQFDRLNRAGDNAERRARDRSRGVQQGLQMAAGAATALGASALGVAEITRRGVLQPMIRESENFEVEMSQLQFVANASGDELQRLRDTAIQTGLATQFSPAQAASALRMLRAAGIDATTTYESLNAVLDVTTASAGTLDLPTAAGAVAAALNKMRGSGESARDMMDAFAEATRNTNLQFENLPIVINAVGDIASSGQFRMPSSELFAFAGILRSTGQLSAQAGQGLRQLGDRLIMNERRIRMAEASGRQLSPTMRNIQESMELFGISVFDANDNIRPMIDIMADIADGMENARNDADRMTRLLGILGPRGRGVANAMAEFRDQMTGLTGGAGIRALVTRLREADGVSRQAAASFENTARGVRIFIQGTIQTILILLGETLAPTLRVLMNVTRAILNRFLELIRANPIVGQAIGFTIVAVVALGFALGTLLIALGGFLFMLASLIPIVTAGAATLAGIATTLGYVLLAVVAVAAAFGSFFAVLIGWSVALYQAYRRNLGGLADFVNDWISDIRLMWSALVDFFQSDDGSISAAIIDQLEDRGLTNGVLNILALTRRIEEVWAGLRDVIVPTVEVLVAVFEFWIETWIWVFNTIEEGLSALGFQFSENMDFWRTLGQVIGVVIVVLTAFVALVTTVLAAAVVLLGVLWLISMLPLILFVALIVGVILIIVQVVRFYRWLGGVIAGWAVAVGEAFSAAWEAVVDWWEGLVEWGAGVAATVAETAAAIWEPFAEFGRRMSVFWQRLTAADAPWRAWAEPWYEENVNQPIVQPIMRGFQAISDFLSGVWTAISGAATAAWNAIASGLSTAWQAVSGFFVSLASGIAQVFTDMWAGIVAGFTAAIEWLGQLFSPLVSLLTSFGAGIAAFFSGLWESISSFFTGLATQAVEWGAGLINGIRDGIQREWAGLVEWFSTNIVEVRDLLPGSDARTGPLSDLTASGSSLVTTFMEGARSAFPGLTATVETSLGQVAGALGLPTTAEGVTGAVGNAATGMAEMASPVLERVGGAVEGVTGPRSVTVNVGDITVQVQQATPEEAERLAEMIMERIQAAIETEGEATFA